MRIFIFGLLLCICQTTLFAQTACNNGTANGFACSDVTLQSLLSVNALGGSGDGSDIWGWTDPTTAKEYALVSVQNGTSFVDISNPVNPTVLGFLAAHNNSSSFWHDIKVINNYAYIGSEASGHGIQIFDLTRLRNVSSPPVTFNTDGRSSVIGNSHNIVALEETGYIIAVGASGANGANGGLVFFDVNTDPTNPTLAGTFSADGYTHDAICMIYRGPDKTYIGKEICIGYNEDTNTIVDVTDKSNMTLISKTPYAGSSYTHQGWVTDDHRYMLVNDEGDESGAGHDTRTYIFDISDLDSPIFMGFYEHPFAAIDHNLYIKGRYAYMANYRSGLRIVDIGDIANANLTEIAGFDTYKNSDSNRFNGAWSNYPYFKSGNVIVSDIEEGLFVLKPTFDHYSFSFVDNKKAVQRVCPGSTITYTLNIDDYGFQSNVALSLSGVDPSLTASLSSNSVAPGGTVTVTITASDGVDPSCVGSFHVLLTGNAGNSSSEQSIALGIIVDDSLAGCSAGVSCPTCDDGVQNQDETGVDCGGAICNACPTCDDGIQNQDETGVDCGGAICNACPDPCDNITYINCNSSIDDNNGNGTDLITAYPDAYDGNNFTGPEQVYEFTVATAGTVNISLSGMSDDLDLFLFGTCDPAGNSIASGTSGSNSTESLSASLAAGTYILFVDGWSNAVSDYTLSISCPAGNCSDGVQNEDETGVDCGGPDCPSCFISVVPKVFIQGAMNGMSMTSGLADIIPTIEPYTSLGYNHVGGGGGETRVSDGELEKKKIVDWVVVELRDKDEPSTIVATRAALLRRDGRVVSHEDASSAVSFDIEAGEYYIAIRHRNHLGVMTSTAVLVD